MDAPPRDTVLLLEEIAANAVAAPTVQLAGGWLVRAWPEAPFRRTNSVLPVRGDDAGEAELEERLALVEELYRRRGLPVRFQLGPVTSPPDLDARLARRGYVVEAPTLLQTADTERVVAATAKHRAAREDVDVALADAIDPGWIAAYGAAQGSDPAARRRVEAYGRLLERLGPRCVTALARERATGGAIGCAFAVLERGWAGVFGMGTHPAARRRGVARAVLHALARRALDCGARSSYLQVEADNAAALPLYAAAGFTTLYGYHYRSLDLPARPVEAEKEDHP